MSPQRICFIGAGYVGGPTSAVLAFCCPQIDVTVVDKNASRVAAWNSDELPFSEPGLSEMVHSIRQQNPFSTCADPLLQTDPTSRSGAGGDRRRNLRVSTDVGEICNADIIFIAVETPSVRENSSHRGIPPDMTRYNAVIRLIAENVKHDFILVNKSTVPCGTADGTQRLLRETLDPPINFEVLSIPEFLAEGTAIRDLLCPDRVLIGSSPSHTGQLAAAKLREIYMNWVPRERILIMGACSAELAKLASNALLAQRISSINALSVLCEELGANITEVSQACGMDHRIGHHMLNASVGFGGSCFKKDLLHLVSIASSLSLDPVASYWRSVLSINEYQTSRFVARIVKNVPIRAASRVIAILGFAFKEGTDDTRESPAIPIAQAWVRRGYFLRIFDSFVPQHRILHDILSGLDSSSFRHNIAVCASVYEACDGAHALAVLNGGELVHSAPASCPDSVTNDMIDGIQHKPSRQALTNREDGSPDNSQRGTGIDWKLIFKTMRRPKYICDGRNVLDHRQLAHEGFVVEGIGRCLAQDFNSPLSQDI